MHRKAKSRIYIYTFITSNYNQQLLWLSLELQTMPKIASNIAYLCGILQIISHVFTVEENKKVLTKFYHCNHMTGFSQIPRK